MLNYVRGVWRDTWPYLTLIAAGLALSLAIHHEKHDTACADSCQKHDDEDAWIIIGAVATGFIAVFAFWQVMESRRSSQRQLRAYVDIDRAEYSKNPEEVDAPWEVHVKLKNFGQTPARRVVIKMETAVVAPRDETTVFDFSANANTHPPTRIPPNHFLTVRGAPWIAAGLVGFAAASHSGNRGYVWGRVNYCDIFNDEHALSFQMGCPFQGVASFVYCEGGNFEEDIGCDTRPTRI